ncbi:MAG: hypothetical protein POH28_13085 [Acidocella sp.]|nr:hypothetical protein [Acidocella sp.]
MDIQTIDSQYSQLQSQAQQTIGELKDLAQKLQTAAAAGNPDAREWLLDLKSIALAIQAEQNQVSNLLQSIHNFADAQQQQANRLPQAYPPAYPQPRPQQMPPKTTAAATPNKAAASSTNSWAPASAAPS